MKANRSKSIKSKDDSSSLSQRAKLKKVAQKMKTVKSKTPSEQEKQPVPIENNEGAQSPRRGSLSFHPRAKDVRRLSLSCLDAIPLEKSSPGELDDSSVSTFTTLETSMHNSYNGSLGGSSRDLYAGGNSSLTRMLGGSDEQLDCSIFLIITNIWETVKRLDGYCEDLAEHIVCHMMTKEPESDIRRQLGLKSFRSPRFSVLARKMVDMIDVLVTMLGPDIDDEELSEMGQGLRLEGVNPKLFAGAIPLALRDLLEEFPKDDFDCWDQAFKFVCSKMDC